MKKVLLSIIAIAFLSASDGFAQDAKVTADLDGDGKQDEFWLYGDQIQYKLSTQKNATKSTRVLDIAGFSNSLSITKNVITLSMWAMRFGHTLKIRYDKATGDFRIIGYDSENFGPANNDGSGKSSYNLLTGDYVANWNRWDEQKEKLIPQPTIKKKIPAKKYFLLKLDDKQLEEIFSAE